MSSLQLDPSLPAVQQLLARPFAGVVYTPGADWVRTLPPVATLAEASAAAEAWISQQHTGDGTEVVLVHNVEGKILGGFRREGGLVHPLAITTPNTRNHP